MDTRVMNANPADYSNYSLTEDWQTTGRLVVGGALLAFGLVQRSKLGYALAVVGGGIVSTALVPLGEASERTSPRKRMIRRAITISKPQEEVYEFWSKPENLERIFPNVESIQPQPDEHWLWKLKFSGYEFEAETEEIVSEPPHRMSWKSVRETPLEQAGSVVLQSAPGGKGTEVQLTISWLASNALAGVALPILGKGSDFHASETLRRAKQLLETGELSTAEFAA